MSDPAYDEILALARALPPEARSRLIGDLAASLAALIPPALAPPQVVSPVAPPAPPSPEEASSSEPLDLRRSEGEAALLVPNGVIAASGRPSLLLDELGLRALARAEQRQSKDDPAQADRDALHRSRSPEGGAKDNLRIMTGLDAANLRQAGWALVVPADDDAALIEALMPLITLRCTEQGIDLPPLEFPPGASCAEWVARYAPPEPPHKGAWHPRRHKRLPVLLYNPPESAAAWMLRHDVALAAGVVDPGRGVPYYLLFVGRPGPRDSADSAYIPFDVQYDVDIYWGAGRLCFSTPDGAHDYEAYKAYAHNLERFEQRAETPYGKHILYIATDHDESTVKSRDGLVRALMGDIPEAAASPAAACGFTQAALIGADAARANLRDALRGNGPGGRPAILFSATHGANFPPYTNPDLVRLQGALVCQDWDGKSSVETHHVLSADDVPPDVCVDGMVVILFACYGVGCPQIDTYARAAGRTRRIAPRDLVAALPQRLLTAGALAVMGHIDVAWSHSFSETGVTAQTQGFEDVLRGLMTGKRVGEATDAFNTRQAALASELAGKLPEFVRNLPVPGFANTWTAYNDARAYIVLGDPAVRLPFGPALLPSPE